MRMKNSTFYFLTITALATLAIIGLFYLSKSSKCCGDCHAHASPTVNRTLAIIKPDAVAAGKTEEIIEAIKDRGFTIASQKSMVISPETAQEFYSVHQNKPFFDELVTFISSGPSVVLILEKDNAISAWRETMGSTNPAEAAPDTLRSLYGTSVGNNALHGSDSPESAQKEIQLLFHEV